MLNFTHVILCEEYNGVSREESSVPSCAQIAQYFVKLTFFKKKCILIFVFVNLTSEIFVNYFNVFKKICISRNWLDAYVIPRARYKNHQICFHVMHQLFLISLFISKEKSFYTRIINNIIKWKRILLILLKCTNIHLTLHVTITMCSFH